MGTVPSFRTWVAGEIVTAAYLNANVRDAGNFMIGEPVAEIYQATVQSLVSTTFTAITFDASTLDSDSGHSNVTNNSRYTGKTSGWFEFAGCVNFAGNATGARGTQWNKNGASVTQSQVMMFAGTAAVTLGAIARTKKIQLNGTTDYVELQGFQSSGGALNTAVASPDGSSMSVKWVHS